MSSSKDKALRDQEAFYARRLSTAETEGDVAAAERVAMDWLRSDRDDAKPYRKLAALKLARGDAAGALDIAVRGLGRIAGDMHLLTLAGEACEQLGDVDGAIRYHSQRAESPDQRRECLLRVARLHQQRGDADAARAALNEAVHVGGGDAARADANATGANTFLKNAAALREGRDVAGAMLVVEAGLAAFHDDIDLLRLGAKLAADMGDTDRALHYCDVRAGLPGQRGDSLVAAARLQLQVYDTAGARAALDAAVEAGVPRESLRLLLARVAVLDRDAKAGLALLDAEEAETGVTPETAALRTKLTKRARDRSREDAIVLGSTATAELRAWAAQSGVPTLGVNTPAQKLITPAGDIMLERAPGSRAIVIAFGGLASMFGGAAEDLGEVVQAKRVNALFVTDPQRLFMLNGFASVGDYRTTIKWIKDLAETWDAPNLYCLGFSAGGYPAIRYGADLGARRVLTFAAPTNFAPGITKIEPRGTALLNRILTRKPDMCENLRDYLSALGPAAPEIINYYGELMPQDAYHGRNIEGLPTVSSRPLAGVEAHGVILHSLKQNKQYGKLLEEFFRDCDD